MNIWLIGYRCTGKTTAGRLAAKKSGRPFADSDLEIVKGCGMTIPDMVSRHGWNFFREKEREIIKGLGRLDNHVISTGGGVILDPANTAVMKQNGKVIWLMAEPETIRERILRDEQSNATHRPSLTSKGLVEEIGDVLNARIPLYEQASHFAIDTNRAEINLICDEILKHGV